MTASLYLRQIHRKKQSDVMRYLQRVRTWEYRQRPAIHPVLRPTFPEKARKLGYRSKDGFSIFRVRVKRGCRKRDYRNGNTHGKPSNAGIYQIKPAINLQAQAEQLLGKYDSNKDLNFAFNKQEVNNIGQLISESNGTFPEEKPIGFFNKDRHRILNSYWVGQDGVHKFYEVIVVDTFCKDIRDDPKINWICNSAHKGREQRGLTSAGRKGRGVGKSSKSNKLIGGSRRACWRRNNTVCLHRFR